DGLVDLFDVNFAAEPKGVWRNTGHHTFEDRSYPSNIASTNLQFLGFGLELFDYDLDGFRDLIAGNGHVLDDPSSLGQGVSYAQSQQLFRNQGDGRFQEDLRSLGDLVHPRVTRGLAVADYDGDGDLDVAMVAQNGPLQLFRNDGGNARHWIAFRLEGVRGSRDAVGAKVTLRAGPLRLAGWVSGGSSYCSSSDRRVTFGLGDAASVQELQVRWPSGRVQRLPPLAVGRSYVLREGGAPAPEVLQAPGARP
ncbi:MAG TPA: CRTAC1 family protein, partial [Armatimonadota bacterium]|nr:CRTAC1 family protein [Armatimonadota bacterium]